MSNTSDIVDRLVRDLKPVPQHALLHHFALGIAPAFAISLFAELTALGLRIDMAEALTLPVFWIKSAYNALIAWVAFYATYRLARPDGSQGPLFGLLAMIFVGMAVIAGIQLFSNSPETYKGLIIGTSALHCPLLIVGFALPILSGMLWVLRTSAPTDLTRTGLTAGIAAGAAGAWVYSWFCTENGMPFVLIWYSTGILLTAVLGAFAGSRLLRW